MSTGIEESEHGLSIPGATETIQEDPLGYVSVAAFPRQMEAGAEELIGGLLAAPQAGL